LIVGGGRAADLVRDLDRTHALGEERSHALALRALDLSAHLLAALSPGLVVVDDPAILPIAWDSRRIPLLPPRRFLETVDASSADPLPMSWRVTTDSIAARLAVHLAARELVLLKSAPLPIGTTRAAAARLGLVDPSFPAVARPLATVTYLNLRDPDGAPLPLVTDRESGGDSGRWNQGESADSSQAGGGRHGTGPGLGQCV
jgi:hypothetical protein